MTEREKVVKGLEVCIEREPGKYTCHECPYETDGNDCEINLTKDALAMLKEQKALLNKAYELLADMGLDFFCEDLICNDGWCDDHCTTNGTTPECIERWLRKQIEEG